PAYRRNTTSWANAARSAASVIACPPYLITTVLPWNRSSHGSASMRTAALAVVLAQGGDPLEPPLACGSRDSVAAALGLLAQGGTASPRGPPRTPDGLEPPMACGPVPSSRGLGPAGSSGGLPGAGAGCGLVVAVTSSTPSSRGRIRWSGRWC